VSLATRSICSHSQHSTVCYDMNVYCDQCCGVLVAYWAYRYLSVLVSPGALWIPRRRSKSHSNSPASTAIGSSRLSSPALYVRYLRTQFTLMAKKISDRKPPKESEHAHSHVTVSLSHCHSSTDRARSHSQSITSLTVNSVPVLC
jgi:hypothetical protein